MPTDSGALSEPLLTRFDPDGMSCQLSSFSRSTSAITALIGVCVALLPALIIALDVGTLAHPAVAAFGGLIGLPSLAVFAFMLLGQRSLSVEVNAQRLVIVRSWGGRLERRTEIAMRSIRTCHAVEGKGLLRVVHEEGELMLPAQKVPSESLSWLGSEVAALARAARERPVGTVPESMEQLLTESGKEALRREASKPRGQSEGS